MDYSTLIEIIRTNLISNQEKKQSYLNRYDICNNYTYKGVFDNLFAFLDYFALGDDDNSCFDTTIRFDNDKITVFQSTGDFTVKELADFFCLDSENFDSWKSQNNNSDDPELLEYGLGLEVYKLSRRQTNEHLLYLRNLVNLVESIEISFETYICTIPNCLKNEDTLEGLIPSIVKRRDDQEYFFMTLYSKDIDKLRKEFIEWSHKPSVLKYLDTSNIVIKSHVLAQNITKSNISDLRHGASVPAHISYEHIKTIYSDEYWAILNAGKISIPYIVSQNIKYDHLTPQCYKGLSYVKGSFAVKLKKDRYKDVFCVDGAQDAMLLYKEGWKTYQFPVQCNFPLVKEENAENIALESIFNKWLLSVLPKLYFSLLKQMYEAMSMNFLTYSTLPYIIQNCDIDIFDIYNSSIQNCDVSFIPCYNHENKKTGEYLCIKDCFVNHTCITGFDTLITKVLSKKYNKNYPNLKGTFLRDTELLRLGIPILVKDDMISILSDQKLLAQLSTQEYAQLFYQIFLTYDDSKELDIEIKRLRKLPCLLNKEGNYVYSRELLFASAINDVKQYSLIHEAFIPLLDKKSKKGLAFRDFLERLGVGEIVAEVIDGVKYIFFVENYTRTVHIIDEEFNYITDLKIAIENLPEMNSCGFVDGNSPYYCEYVYEEDCELHHDRFIKVGLVVENIKYSTAIVDLSGKIIVPFGYKRGMCTVDEENDCICLMSVLSRGYKGVSYILTNDCIYSFSGEKMFPNETCQYDGINIIHKSDSGAFIGVDVEGKYFIIQKDYTVVPVDGAIGGSKTDRFSYTFKFWSNGLMKARFHAGEYSYDRVISSQGKLLLSGTEVIYDEKLDKIIRIMPSPKNDCIYDTNCCFQYYLVRTEYTKYYTDYHDEKIAVNSSVLKVSKLSQVNGDSREYFGLADKNLNIVFPIICENLDLLYEGGPYRIKVNGKFGLVDSLGRLAIPPCYDYIAVKGSEVRVLYTITDFSLNENNQIIGGKRRIIDIQGNELVKDVDFDRIVQVENFIIAKRTNDPERSLQNGLYGVFDSSFNIIIPFEYDYIKYDQRHFLYNKGGQIDKSTSAIIGGKWGVKLGDIFTDCIYDSIEICFWGEYIKVELNNKQGLLDSNGNVIIPTEFDVVFPSFNKNVRVNNGGVLYDGSQQICGGSWCFYNIDEQKIVSPNLDFEYVGDINNGLIVYRKDGRFGYLNDKYNVHITHMFEYAGNFNNEGVAKVILDGKRILIDKLGNEVGIWRETSQDEDYDYQDDIMNWEEEAWYYLTGGQYGDYPGGDVDYDFLGL